MYDQLNLSHTTEFLDFNLAPLNLRRDIAMLGLLHKCALGTAHSRLRKPFPRVPTPQPIHNTRHSKRRHTHQLKEHCTNNFLEVMRQSIFGLVRVYNFLPQQVIDAPSVTVFQRTLTSLAKDASLKLIEDWSTVFSPRYTQQG